MERVAKPHPESNILPLQALHVGPHASELGRWQGDTDNGVMPTGQSAGLIHEICSAKEVATDIVQEAAKALERFGRFSHRGLRRGSR